MHDAPEGRGSEQPPEPLRVRPSPGTVGKRMDDQYVLIQLETNRIYQLNRTGAQLWELLEAGRDLEQAQEQMQREFDVDEQQLRREVSTLVGELVAKGLLELDAGT